MCWTQHPLVLDGPSPGLLYCASCEGSSLLANGLEMGLLFGQSLTCGEKSEKKLRKIERSSKRLVTGGMG